MLEVDPTSAVPPFEQLRQRITAQISSGELRPGDRLPPVRRLAEDLGIAANTVAHAYRTLEADGLLQGRGRAGTFVADDDSGRAAHAAARTYAATVQALGLNQAEAVELVRRAMSS
ncbi:GntR family transcriptional regulator [Georgenia soli]|uniref:GntR family transcriptional regulator n=1 Tax=Georgenia soli TaxID=638953 RepID=A0A2A9ENR1_9MICO|nr:GntR family transcriptional regulator [Georgenia soli]PFG39880.1 GntR family transcriptional regulator [Georgenia soli]